MRCVGREYEEEEGSRVSRQDASAGQMRRWMLIWLIASDACRDRDDMSGASRGIFGDADRIGRVMRRTYLW